MSTYGSGLRRGLPRHTGGDLWPPSGRVPAPTAGTALGDGQPSANAPATATGVTLRRGLPRSPGGDSWPRATGESRLPADVTVPRDLPESAEQARPVRRGLPRTAGGDPWPPARSIQIAVRPSPTTGGIDAAKAATTHVPVDVNSGERSPQMAVTTAREPLVAQRTAWAGQNAFMRAVPAPGPQRVGPFTAAQWAGVVVLGGAGLLFAAAMAVFFVRWLLSLAFMQDFLTSYPGEYRLPEAAPVGLPGWMGWQHFLNVFLMVLIIRSGLHVRRQAKPPAFWSPRWNRARKISINLWFHQSLDILWLVNGVAFVVLLFVSGQWVRIIPTSWEVVPNAFSAALQYVSLDWPTENGWVNYNSLQQLAYFATVFLAAPLAAVTGYRMSGLWPNNQKLNKLYPVEWARSLHFPVMLYFCAFIFVHVALVFATGALRNLNHMYAAQDAVNWVGFWVFVASLAVIAAAWVAARPLVLAPVAKLSGAVSER